MYKKLTDGVDIQDALVVIILQNLKKKGMILTNSTHTPYLGLQHYLSHCVNFFLSSLVNIAKEIIHNIWANLKLIILFSKLLKFSKKSEKKILKENK